MPLREALSIHPLRAFVSHKNALCGTLSIMQIADHDHFVDALHTLHEVRVTFRSKEDGGGVLSRRCAPMDFGPSRRAKDKTPRYHFWDFESDSGSNHVLSLPATQILSVEVLESTFDPSSFVAWNTPWIMERTTWGDYNLPA